MMKKLLVAMMVASALTACQESETTKEAQPVAEVSQEAKPASPGVNTDAMAKTLRDYKAEAKALSQKYMIADLHVDVPYRLESQVLKGKHADDVSSSTDTGDFDYPRAKAGGLDAPFMSIYIPANIEAEGGNSTEVADKLIDGVEAIVKGSPEKFALAYSTQQLEDNFKKGLISLPLGMENGSPIAGDLKNLEHFYQRGIRYITLSHALSNHISDSSYDKERPAQGLTDFGKELVVAMNDTGVMVDVSHISDQAFEHVMEISKAPVIASHSSARHFTPGFERNMSDEMIKKLAENDGVIFINFGSTFVHQASIESYEGSKVAIAKFMKTQGIESQEDEAVVAFKKKYYEENPFVFAEAKNVIEHFDHVVKLVGIEHVGIGSDYDGVGDSLPTGLKDVSTYPYLIELLLKRGYSEADIEKVLSGNLMRVWKAVEDYSKK